MLKNVKCRATINDIYARLSKNTGLIYVGIFFLFVVYASIANWSLLVGENLMKYDIWDAEYPNQMLMTDALANGVIMKWNPLMRYGTPTYAMLGTPVWYPVTLLLALIGYTPVVLAFSYVLHIAIGGFGMFLLGQQELRRVENQRTAATLTASFIVGLIYCSSGLFLSNAQHIMIIISAAWIPYVFFFVRKYLEEHRMVFAMLAGASAGMILLGGYPELFYDTFLFLAPYTLYFQYEKQKSVISNIFIAIKKYINVCFNTVLCGAIILLPFLNSMSLLTRTNGLGQVPMEHGLSAFLSILFPGTANFAYTGEISMVNFYVGILTILLFPAVLKLKNRNKLFYLGMSLTALILCLGTASFLHDILYRFFPMYSSFRFPSINRCILTMFLLLNVVNVLYDIMSHREIILPLKLSKMLCLLLAALAGITGIVAYMANDSFGLNQSNMIAFSNSAYLAVIVTGGYLLLFYGIYYNYLNGALLKAGMIGIVVLDLLTFHHAEFPITIALCDQTAYSNNSDVRERVNREITDNANRNRTIDFTDSSRASSQLNSQTIVFNRYLDEDGYVSVLLQNVQNFKNTYLRNIMQDNPEAYFTNDVVTPDEVQYHSWANSVSTPPEQIYVEEEDIIADPVIRFKKSERYSEPLAMTSDGETVCIEGNIGNTGGLQTRKLRLVYESVPSETLDLIVSFYDSDGNCSQCGGEYQVEENENGVYVDVYFPDVYLTYNKIEVISQSQPPTSALLVYSDRIKRDEYVNITSFSFNDIAMTVDAPTDGYVVILQAKYNGWKVYVDGVEAEISTVDNCFMGVRVTEGKHGIVLKFRPIDFYIGAAISLLFAVLLCGAIVHYYFSRKK